MLKNTYTSYGSIARFSHWLIFFLMFFMILYGYTLAFEVFSKDTQPTAINIHKLVGLFILIYMVLRFGWALINVKPILPVGTKPWQRTAERTVQWLFYATIIAMPISGWVMSMAAGHPPHIGNMDLSLPIEKNKWLAGVGFDIHKYLALVIIALVAIHASAALYHHFVKKDNVLRRMLSDGSH